MLIRNGKIQFLFWTAFFSVFVFVWIAWIGLQVFILPDEKSMTPPQNAIVLLFVLYGMEAVLLMAGTFVSVMINNRFYRKLFGIFTMVAMASLLYAKSISG